MSLETKPETISRNQIRWQCRRGMLELDLILLPFFDACFSELTEPEQAVFIEFLGESDQTLYRCLMNQTQAPKPEWQALLDRIRAFTWKA